MLMLTGYKISFLPKLPLFVTGHGLDLMCGSGSICVLQQHFKFLCYTCSPLSNSPSIVSSDGFMPSNQSSSGQQFRDNICSFSTATKHVHFCGTNFPLSQQTVLTIFEACTLHRLCNTENYIYSSLSSDNQSETSILIT